MSDSLKHFMVTLATDVDALAAFIIDPDGYRIEAYYGPGET